MSDAPVRAALGLNVAHTYRRGGIGLPWPLAQAADAHRAFEDRETAGSITLLP